jgi:CDP-paratose synthetase
MTNKTILITGGTGFLGANLINKLSQTTNNLIILKRSTSDLRHIHNHLNDCKFYDIDNLDLDILFKENSIDIIVHAATNYGRGAEEDSEIINTNILFPLNLLNLSIKYRVEVFINFSTALSKNINPYTISKNHFQDWLSLKKDKIKVINLVLEYIYGPFDRDWKFITMVIRKLLKNVDYIEFSSGVQKRDFIFIDDVVDAFLLILFKIDSINTGISIPIGSGKCYELKQIVQLCHNYLPNSKTKLLFDVLQDRKNEIYESCADLSTLNSLGWSPRYSIELGIKNTIEKEIFNFS